MKNTNVVLEGKYKNLKILGGKELSVDSEDYIGGCPLDKQRIASYTLINENNKSQYSFWKGALGVALLGGVGAVAGIGGKKTSEYLIAVEWKNGEKSLICLDDKFYKVFVQSMFQKIGIVNMMNKILSGDEMNYTTLT